MNPVELVRFFSFMSLVCFVLALLDCPEAHQFKGLAAVFGAAATLVDRLSKETPASDSLP